MTPIAFAIQAIVLFGISPFQGDGHHDGIVFAPSVAFSEGLIVQKDAFSLYGPLNVWLYGSILKIFPNQVLVLRLTVALLSLLTAWIMYRVLKHTSLSDRAIWITSAWTIANAVYMTSFPASPLPWASVTANLSALIGLYILVNKKESGNQDWKWFRSGIFFGLSTFARIQFIAFIPILVLLALITKQSKEVKRLVWMISGILFGLFSVIGILYKQGALIPYINQSIIYPLTKYPNLGFSTNYNLYLFTLIFSVPLLAFGLMIFARKWLKHLNSSTIVIIAMGLLLAFNFFGRRVVPNDNLPLLPRVVVGEIIEKSGLWLNYFSALACLVALLNIVKNYNKNRDNKNLNELTFISLGIIGLLQLYPYPDVQHLWWASPLLIPTLQWVPKVVLTQEFLLLCKGTILTGLILFALFLQQPWYEFKNHSMKGIYASKEKVELYEVFLAIEKFTSRQAYRFDCEDGIHSVATGEYLSADEWFVNWGNIQNESPLPSTVKAIFICDKDAHYARKYASRVGWEIIFFDEASNSSGFRSLAILEPKTPK